MFGIIINLVAVVSWGAWAGYFAFADKPSAPTWLFVAAFVCLAINSLISVMTSILRDV